MEGLRNTTKFHNQDNYYMGTDLNTPPANTHTSLLLKPICHSPQFVTYNKPRQNQFQLLALYLHSITSLIPTLNSRKRKCFSFVVNNSSSFPPFFWTYGDAHPSLQPSYRRKHACICKEFAFINANNKVAWSRPPYPKTDHQNKIRYITINIQC